MKNSPTYIIKVVNTSNEVAEGVVVGHSYVSRFENNFGEEPNIKITSPVPNISYDEFLAVTEKQPFQVVQTIINATSPLQLEEEISIIHRKPENALQIEEHPVTTRQKENLISKHKFLFDGEAKIWFRKINGNAEVTIYLY